MMDEGKTAGAPTVTEESKRDEDLKASDEAVAFMASIEPEELQRCVFPESLVPMSDGGRVLGEFSVSVEFTRRVLQPCLLLHAQSHGAIDGSPCGTTVTAYLTVDLEVLEEDYHEYIKLDNHSVEKRCHMVQHDRQMMINKCTTVGEEMTKECVSYPMSALRGLVTEGSSLLLMRLMALRKKSELGVKRIEVCGEVFGVQRMVGSVKASSSTWQCYFLDDGRLASRKQVGSPVTMKLLQQPAKTDKGPEKVSLVWEEDMQLHSQYLERKDKLKAEHASYLREQPEIRALLSEFMQDLLIMKPDNIYQFAREYFLSFSSSRSSDSNLKTRST
ncbi:ciliogenesis-associated TTC17-interacting protein isoform X2 [Girardinichthys multiradiatus]|uniref:ciliogenesis-associated TTC17-interacting protein isoform X2 n=1 Tax=Girardinichthys multiradiatus TaxID=208333 RepID=UPI001FAE1A16|nr:ciliogenesis-associated TTC17-interacting protein isoform X2 [Girardinichthys multiradiatus]